jgi:hypothetical protein
MKSLLFALFAVLMVFKTASAGDLSGCTGKEIYVCGLEFSPQSTQIAVHTGRDVHLLDLLNAGSKRIHVGRFVEITKIRFSSDGRLLFVAKSNRKNAFFSVPDGNLAYLIETNSRVTDARFIPKTNKIILAFWNGRIDVWDYVQNKRLQSSDGHMFGAVHLNISANAEFLISAGADQTLRLWRLKDLSFQRYFADGRYGIKAAKAMLNGAVFADGGKAVLSTNWLPYCGRKAPVLQLFDTKDGSVRRQLHDKSGCGVRIFAASENTEWAIFRDGVHGTAILNVKAWSVSKIQEIKHSMSAAISRSGLTTAIAEPFSDSKSVNIRFLDTRTAKTLGIIGLSWSGFLDRGIGTHSANTQLTLSNPIFRILADRIAGDAR